MLELNRHKSDAQTYHQLEAEVEKLRKRLDQLSDQLEFFQILLDSIPTPLYFEDLDKNITLCNMAFETVIQSIREDVIGHSLCEILQDSELSRVLTSSEIKPENALEPYSSEHEVSFADGSTRHVEVRHVVYFNLEGEPAGTVGMIIDLTDQKRAEQAEIEADRLRTAQKLAISIAHEFNNPLMIISGVYQLMKPAISNTLDDAMKEHMERMPRAVERMHDLVQKLLKLNSLKEAEYAGGQKFYDLHSDSRQDSAKETSSTDVDNEAKK